VTVVDFTQVYWAPAAPSCSGLSVADVIKIERPGTGDLPGRPSWTLPDWTPGVPEINRNKRSVTLNTRSNRGKQVVLDLVGTPT